MKRTLRTLVASVMLICLVPAMVAVTHAGADNDEVTLSMTAEPSAGPLFRDVHRPVSASLKVSVSSPERDPEILPLKVANVEFPRDMEFFPDPSKTPVCPPDKVGVNTALAIGILAVVENCPDSVIGTGSAVVQVSRNKGREPIPTLRDPRMVIFNAGRNKAGRPMITIYGHSKLLNSGLLMRGTLARSGQLKINIGVLPFDSSVSEFVFDVPGKGLELPDGTTPTSTTTVKGQDPGYLRAKCSTGLWNASGSFVLGLRHEASGLPLGDDFFVRSNSFDLPCEGRRGVAKLRIGKVSGPKQMGPGTRKVFRVRVSNPGTAHARQVRLVARGRAVGSVTVGTLPAGVTRLVRIPARSLRKKGLGPLNFVLSGQGSKSARLRKSIRIR